DDGRLTDGKGRTVDFRNTVVIMTSNVASDLIMEMAQRGRELGDEGKDRLMEVLRGTFRPEFLNRIDEIVIFRSLGPEQIEQIVGIQMRDVQKRLGERKIAIELTDEARKVLAERGYDPVFGARPLKRVIQRVIENPLAVEVLAGKFREGDHIIVDSPDRESFVFKKEAAVPQPA
ncbi:MAG TPA: AAA family ATPase, partial [Vicinamibacteria bacterium]